MLNYGHTVGHALEAAAGLGNRLLHGEAVAVGMRAAGLLSIRVLGCPSGDIEWQDEMIARCGLATALVFDPERVLGHMRADKKPSANVSAGSSSNPGDTRAPAGAVPEVEVRGRSTRCSLDDCDPAPERAEPREPRRARARRLRSGHPRRDRGRGARSRCRAGARGAVRADQPRGRDGRHPRSASAGAAPDASSTPAA